jgi:hypothetical protein
VCGDNDAFVWELGARANADDVDPRRIRLALDLESQRLEARGAQILDFLPMRDAWIARSRDLGEVCLVSIAIDLIVGRDGYDVAPS